MRFSFKPQCFYGIYTYMKMVLRILTAVLFCLAGDYAHAAAHTKARLVLAAETTRPGDTVLVGIHLHMDPKWHTYWRNPSGPGVAPSVVWDLPKGVKAGEIQWLLPEKLVEKMPDGDVATFIYQNDVLLLVPLSLSTDLQKGPLELKATLSWVECEVSCVLGGGNVRASLNVGTETKPSAEAALLEQWQKRIPKKGQHLNFKASWEEDGKRAIRPLILEWSSTTRVTGADFFPYEAEGFELQPAVERLPAAAGTIKLRARLKKIEEDWPKEIAGVAVEKTGDERLGWEVKAPIEGGPSLTETAGGSTGKSKGVGSLWLTLVYAFLGGLILNVMPCVLPVIALKILGFVAQAKEDIASVRKLGLIYGAGVLCSFLLLAGLVIGVKAAGHKAGWGMQFGNPQFIIVLTVLVTLVALNLFGLFEVNLSGQVMGAAGELASKHGPTGAFFNGVLATVLATPCSAPFLSIALGFAFSQSAVIIVLVFFTVGLGLAFPYVLLSWEPHWLKFLPKPGPWMEKFKIAMGFPMLATALWLFSLLPIHYGERSWWLGIFLVIIALAAWVFGEFVQRRSTRRAAGLITAIALLITGYVAIIETKLQWRSPVVADVIQWQRWSPEAVASAQARGRPVLVDFTASWCLTCNSIVKPAIEDETVRRKLEAVNGVALLADYSRFSPDITAELERHERAAVPLVLVYPGNPSASPIVLPEPLPFLPPSHYRGLILEALSRAVTPVQAMK